MDYENFIGKEITKEQLYAIFPNSKFYELISSKKLFSDDYSYCYGSRGDILDINNYVFDLTSEEFNGFYFFHKSQIKEFYKYVNFDIVYIREVTFPDDVRIYVEKGKMKADKIILEKSEKFYIDFYMNEKECLSILQKYPEALEYVKDQTEELCLTAVKQNGRALQFVKNQTEAICLAAVKNYGGALYYVKEQTEAICLAAVKNNGLALRYVEYQTEAICLEAVKRNGRALEYVKEQTEAICLEAVKRNGRALEYVKEQTEAICLASTKKDIDNKKYITHKLYTQIKFKKIYYFTIRTIIFATVVIGTAVIMKKIGIEF